MNGSSHLLNLTASGKSSIATAEDLQDFEDRKRELEMELERRKRVGADVGKVVGGLL